MRAVLFMAGLLMGVTASDPAVQKILRNNTLKLVKYVRERINDRATDEREAVQGESQDG